MILSWAPWVACANASQLPTSPPPPPLFSGTAPCHLSVLESPGDLQHALTNPTYMATFPWQRLGCAWTFSCNSPLGRKTVSAWPKPHRHPWKIPLSSAIDSGHNQIAFLLPIEPLFFGGGQCFLKCYLIAIPLLLHWQCRLISYSWPRLLHIPSFLYCTILEWARSVRPWLERAKRDGSGRRKQVFFMKNDFDDAKTIQSLVGRKTHHKQTTHQGGRCFGCKEKNNSKKSM